jgi:transcriptional regulator with XRE-family HTH domain
MGKKNILAVLGENLRRLMDAHPDLSSSPKMATKTGIAARTINNVENQRHDAKVGTVEAIAKAFGLQPYQLLCPTDDKEFFLVCKAWNLANESGRDLLLGAAETVIRRHGTAEGKSRAADD